jgi:hypothetical protein
VIEPAPGDDRIGIQKQDVFALRHAGRNVITAGEAVIPVETSYTDSRVVGRSALQLNGRPIARVIIHGDDFVGRISCLVANRIEARSEVLSRIVGQQKNRNQRKSRPDGPIQSFHARGPGVAGSERDSLLAKSLIMLGYCAVELTGEIRWALREIE